MICKEAQPEDVEMKEEHKHYPSEADRRRNIFDHRQ
jgi:hypothetical protein